MTRTALAEYLIFKRDAYTLKQLQAIILGAKKRGCRKRYEYGQILRCLGFFRVGNGVYSTVYAHKACAYVIKVSDGLSTEALPPKLNRYVLKYVYVKLITRKPVLKIGIQLKADVKDQRKAWKALARITGVAPDVLQDNWDIHMANVGWHKGQPVIIDYVA